MASLFGGVAGAPTLSGLSNVDANSLSIGPILISEDGTITGASSVDATTVTATTATITTLNTSTIYFDNYIFGGTGGLYPVSISALGTGSFLVVVGTQGVRVGVGYTYQISNGVSQQNVLSLTTLGSTVVNSSLTSLGTLTSLVANASTTGTIYLTSTPASTSSSFTLNFDGNIGQDDFLLTTDNIRILTSTGEIAGINLNTINSSGTIKIGGTTVLNSTTLGSGIINSSLRNITPSTNVLYIGDTTANRYFEFSNTTGNLDFISSGIAGTDYNARIRCENGTATAGSGDLSFDAGSFTFQRSSVKSNAVVDNAFYGNINTSRAFYKVFSGLNNAQAIGQRVVMSLGRSFNTNLCGEIGFYANDTVNGIGNYIYMGVFGTLDLLKLDNDGDLTIVKDIVSNTGNITATTGSVISKITSTYGIQHDINSAQATTNCFFGGNIGMTNTQINKATICRRSSTNEGIELCYRYNTTAGSGTTANENNFELRFLGRNTPVIKANQDYEIAFESTSCMTGFRKPCASGSRSWSNATVSPNTPLIQGGTLRFEVIPTRLDTDYGLNFTGTYNGMYRAGIAGYYRVSCVVRTQDNTDTSVGLLPKTYNGTTFTNIFPDDGVFWMARDGGNRFSGCLTFTVSLTQGLAVMVTTYDATNINYSFQDFELISSS